MGSAVGTVVSTPLIFKIFTVGGISVEFKLVPGTDRLGRMLSFSEPWLFFRDTLVSWSIPDKVF